MNPYKGIIRIIRTKKTGCRAVTGKDVRPSCMACPDAVLLILDLDDTVLFEYTAPVPAPLKSSKPAKKKTS